jgi:N,N'-diacetyllegionaminate synthase
MDIKKEKIDKINLIAEIGWNHMGDMKLASSMIKQAAEAGADYCKFQTWSEKNLKIGNWDNDGRREIYKKAQLNIDQHKYLISECYKNNVKFLTSVFNINDLPMITNLGIDEIKIPSHEIYNVELIKVCLDIFSKVFISTGASKWQEVEAVVNLGKKEKIILMHCVSAYPCKPENINLPRLQKLINLGFDVGYSGHMSGINDAIAAICMGSTYVEKHFTVDNSLPGRDNLNAITPNLFAKLSEFRNNFFDMIIDRGLDFQDCEKDIYTNYRGRWIK